MRQRFNSLLGSDRADVHRFAAARGLDHGLEALGGAKENLGLLQVVLLLRLQSCFQVLLLPALQEVQLLNHWRTEMKPAVHMM